MATPEPHVDSDHQWCISRGRHLRPMAGSRPEAKAKRDKKKTALLIIWRCWWWWWGTESKMHQDRYQHWCKRCVCCYAADRIELGIDALLLWNVMRFCEEKKRTFVWELQLSELSFWHVSCCGRKLHWQKLSVPWGSSRFGNSLYFQKIARSLFLDTQGRETM